MRRTLAFALMPLALAACSGQARTADAKRAATSDLILVQATYAPSRYGKVEAPVDALTISGTISNKGRSQLICDTTAFIVTDGSGASFTPVSTSCQVPRVGPGGADAFSATFRTPLRAKLRLHYEHGDGTYESRDLFAHT